MIDTAGRKIAADLVRRFKDGDLTNYQLEEAWPEGKEDRALRAVASMLWCVYSDGHEHALVGRHAPDDRLREELSRYAAFLDTDLPYEWSRDNFYGIGGLGSLVPLSLGLLWPLDAWIRARNAKRDERLRQEGDLSVWPYMRASDYRS